MGQHRRHQQRRVVRCMKSQGQNSLIMERLSRCFCLRASEGRRVWRCQRRLRRRRQGSKVASWGGGSGGLPCHLHRLGRIFVDWHRVDRDGDGGLVRAVRVVRLLVREKVCVRLHVLRLLRRRRAGSGCDNLSDLVAMIRVVHALRRPGWHERAAIGMAAEADAPPKSTHAFTFDPVGVGGPSIPGGGGGISEDFIRLARGSLPAAGGRRHGRAADRSQFRVSRCGGGRERKPQRPDDVKHDVQHNVARTGFVLLALQKVDVDGPNHLLGAAGAPLPAAVRRVRHAEDRPDNLASDAHPGVGLALDLRVLDAWVAAAAAAAAERTAR